MKRAIWLMMAIMLVVSIFSQGCATMMASSDPPMRIKITSEPTGATIKIDQEKKGETPLTVDLPKGRYQYTVTAQKDGYETATQNVSIWVNSNVYLNLIPQGVGLFSSDPEIMTLGLLGGLVGWIVDGVSDNWYKADRNTLNFSLEPKK